MALDLTCDNYGYLLGRMVSMTMRRCADAPRVLPALVADDINKLTYWQTEALKREVENLTASQNADEAADTDDGETAPEETDGEQSDIMDVAARLITHKTPPRLLAADLNTYWVGYYHQQAEYSRLDSRMRIGAAIRQARESQGLTIRELAKRAGLGGYQIVRIEKGTYNANLDTIAKVAAVLDLTINIDQ